MIAHSIFFYTFSIIAVVSAIMVTVSKNTVHSVFFLILDFISISCLFIMIGAEFLGMIMLIVYVGAVAVLFLFFFHHCCVCITNGHCFKKYSLFRFFSNLSFYKHFNLIYYDRCRIFRNDNADCLCRSCFGFISLCGYDVEYY